MNAPQPMDRSQFLGGTDAAAVMGVSPWSTPVELWQQKTGRVPPAPPDAVQLKRFDRGRKLEPFIRDMAIDRLRADGHVVELLACNQRYSDPEHPFLSCEIDFELMLDGEHINADAKSVSGFAHRKWGDENTEDVPIEYAAQFMHGLMVTGRRRCLVAALRSFDDVDIFWTLRDDETIAAMREKLVRFWLDHVQADVQPDPLHFDDIKALFPLDNGQAIEATHDIADKVAQLREVKARIKEFEEAESALKLEVAEFISPNTALMFGGREICTWKAQETRRLDTTRLREAEPGLAARFTHTTTTRVLRMKGPK